MSVALLTLTAALALTPAGDAKLPPRSVSRLGTLNYSHASVVKAVDYAGDGQHVVALSASAVHVWDSASREIQRIDVDGLLPKTSSKLRGLVRFRDDSKTIVCCGPDGFFLWDFTKQTVLHREQLPTHSAAISSDARYLYLETSASDAKINGIVFDLDKPQRVGTPLPLPAKSRVATITSDGKRVALGSDQGTINVWDALSAKMVSSDQLANAVNALLFAPDGKTLLSSTSYSGLLRAWHLDNAVKTPILGPTGDGVIEKELTISRDGSLLAWDDGYGMIVWDLKKSMRKYKLPANPDGAAPLAFAPDLSRIVSANDRTLNLWELKTAKLLTPRESHRGAVIAVAFAPDAKTVVTLGDDEKLIRWKSDGALLSSRGSRGSGAFTFAHGGPSLAIASATEVSVRNLTDFRVEKSIKPNETIQTVALSPDAKTLAVALLRQPLKKKDTAKAIVRFIDVKSGKTSEADPQLQRIDQLRFNPVGTNLLIQGAVLPKKKSSTESGKLLCYDLASNTFRFTLDRQVNALHSSLAYTKDGAQFISLDSPTQMLLCDAKTGKLVRSLHDDKKQPATAFAISPRTGTLAMAFGDLHPRIEFWDLAANKKLDTLQAGHRGAIRCLAFSDDEAHLVSGSDDTTALVWDLKGIVK